MIVVTGLRSGTSLMMQTLKLLGVPVKGFLFHDDFSHKELNPKGYYDLPINETLNGINHHDYKGFGVKLGAVQLNRTPSKYVSKILFCSRKRQDTIKSIEKLIEADREIIKKYCGEKIIPPELIYDDTNNMIEYYLNKTTIPYMEIKYEYMLKDPEYMINQICDFLGIKIGIEKAVQNVDKEKICQ